MANRFFLDRDYAYAHPSALKRDTLGALNFRNAVFIFVVLFVPCLGALLLANYIVGDIITDRAYLVEGREMIVTLTGCSVVSGTRSNNVRASYSYVVDGQTFTGEHSIANLGSRCEEYPAGVTYAGLYLLSNPAESRVVDERVSTAAWYRIMSYAAFTFTGVSCGYVGIALILHLLLGLIGSLRYLRLKSKGILLDGELVDIKEEKVGRYKTDHRLNVTYRFQTPDGRTLTRKQCKIRNDLRLVKLPAVGTPVSVLYADDDAVVML